MKVDVQSLDTFNGLAHEGAEAATAALSQLTGIEATVDVTRISLIDRADIGDELRGREFQGAGFDFEGALDGRTVVVFEEDGAGEILDRLVPETAGDELARSGIEELGNIMMSGFIDGWADYLGATIEHTPPEYVERSGEAVLPAEPAEGGSDQLFVFRSEIECAGTAVGFYIYMLPEYGSLVDVMGTQAAEGADAIPVEKLEVFNGMTREGTQKAADNAGMVTGIETDAEVTRISFCPIEDVPRQVGTDTYVGTVVEFTGTPSGYLLVLFDEASALTVAEQSLPTSPDGEGLTDRHRNAVEELGNIMTSGFIDGWANVLQTTIEHTPPRLVHDMGRSIVDPVAARLGQNQQHAFVIDSTMRTDDVDFECKIYALPDEAELRRALNELDVDRADETEADLEGIF
jgi:two-component system chemotaxis sensor kinase CheA/chemotaxis protein CheC